MATIDEQSEKVIRVEEDVEMKGSPTAGKRKSEASESGIESPVKKQLKSTTVEGLDDEDSIQEAVTPVNGSDAEETSNDAKENEPVNGEEEASKLLDEGASGDEIKKAGQEAEEKQIIVPDIGDDAAPELTKEEN